MMPSLRQGGGGGEGSSQAEGADTSRGTAAEGAYTSPGSPEGDEVWILPAQGSWAL